ncbi:MAG: energy transducer TonB [Candidatus Omnitrophota bacterium]
MTKKRKSFRFLREIVHRLYVMVGAAALTAIFFLVLPLMQTLTKPPSTDMIVQAADTANLDAPDPPPEPEPEEEPEAEDRPPQLMEEAPPLDLSQLELALNPSLNEGLAGGDFAVKLNTAASEENNVDALFSIADLDQKPRVIYQPSPMIGKEARQNAPGTVYIVFVVDQQGRVENPIVQKSTNPVFDKPALSAVKQWKFEPGKRNGQPVRFRMRVPITFPKGS